MGLRAAKTDRPEGQLILRSKQSIRPPPSQRTFVGKPQKRSKWAKGKGGKCEESTKRMGTHTPVRKLSVGKQLGRLEGYGSQVET